MIQQSLGGAWRLLIPGSSFPETAANVPGSVYHDLLTAGLIPDPFWRDNENEALKIMEHDFIYGYSVKDALQRREIDPSTVTIGFVDYID